MIPDQFLNDLDFPAIDITNIAVFLDGYKSDKHKDGVNIQEHFNNCYPFQLIPFDKCLIRSSNTYIPSVSEFISLTTCSKTSDNNYSIVHNIGIFKRRKIFSGLFYSYKVSPLGEIFHDSITINYYDSEGYSITNPDLFDDLTATTVLFVRSLVFSISLMNCKNIEYVTEPKAALKLLHNRKKHKKNPRIIYKILNIKPITNKLHYEGDINANGINKAMHLGRGHFRSYGEEKPLFGRIVGRFWTPMHVRGNKDQGQVFKDYKISTPNKTNKEQL